MTQRHPSMTKCHDELGCSWGATLPWLNAKVVEVSKSNNFVPGRRRTILTVFQTPRMELLMASKSAAEADQVLLIGKPLNGGGPLYCSEST